LEQQWHQSEETGQNNMGEHLLEAEQPLLVRRSLRLKRVIATALIIFKISS
jgi:hypothetical protein